MSDLERSSAQQTMDRLVEVAEKIAGGDYSEAGSLFNMTIVDEGQPNVSRLAEAFGKMMVQVEAREFGREQLIEKLQVTNRQLEAAVAKLEEMNKFMAILVHELRSPLATSVSIVNFTLDCSEVDEGTCQVLNKVLAHLHKLLGLVDEILALSRAGDSKSFQVRELFDLVDQTRSSVEGYRDQAASKGLTLDVSLPATPLFGQLNRKIYHLVVSNLVSNAIKYTKQGSVRVTLERNAAGIVGKVTDTGIGIPADEVSKLFGQFFRASNAVAARIPGSGIGLAAIKGFVIRLGGTLEVDTAEGRGSTFTFALPLQVEERGS